MATKKEYNDCNDVEKHIIREYAAWVKSEAPLNLRIAKGNEFRARAKKLNIDHLL